MCYADTPLYLGGTSTNLIRFMTKFDDVSVDLFPAEKIAKTNSNP